MEKNRIRPIKSGKSSRMSYSRQKEVLQMPNLIEGFSVNFLEFRMYPHNLLCFLSYKAAADSPEAPEYLWNPYGVLAESPQKIRWAASIKMRTKRLSLLRRCF